MAKVNLLTLHYADNNGSVLQTYATCKILESLGHEVTLINLQNKDTVIGKYRSFRAWLSLPRYLKFWWFRQKYFPRMTRRMFVIKQKFLRPCDCTVVGSDQVWNPDFKIVKTGAYFLNFIDGKKVALASSFGKREWKAPDDFTEKVRQWLSVFSAISVRESAGVSICKEVFNLDSVQVVDPTLALGNFCELLDCTPHNEKEIRCFLFKDKYSLDVVDYVSKKEKLPVRQVGRKGRRGYAKSPFWFQSPIDWLKMIRDSKIWISDSFHGIACAIVLKKQFIALCADPRKLERISSLLALFGLGHRLVLSLDDLKNRYCEIMTPIDYCAVEEILDKEKIKYRLFIQENI